MSQLWNLMDIAVRRVHYRLIDSDLTALSAQIP